MAIDSNDYIFVSTDSAGVFRSVQPTTAVKEITNGTPTHYSLEQNYPNPFNPQTVIRFYLAGEHAVQLCIFDAAGRLVRTLADKNYSMGKYAISWDGKDVRGAAVTNGVYFYRLKVKQQSQTRKMVLMR
jgi:hypothetical protein